MAGLPKYCKHLYTHNPTSSSKSYGTQSTIIQNCPSCRYLRRIAKEALKKVKKEDSISASLVHDWLNFPIRCQVHKELGNKRRFGSGFSRRRWKEERHLNGGKYSNAK